jgi:tetratricopeptide (TPR) repeat protein
MAEKNAKKGAAEQQPALNQKEDFILKYKNALIGGVIALIVIVGGIVFYNNHKSAKLTEAQTAQAVPELSFEKGMEALSQSAGLFEGKDFEQALNGDSTGVMGFLKIADQYSSTKAGNLANLYAGLCYAHMYKWEEAVKYLEKFDTSDDLLISPAALGALGNAYAHVNQMDKAVSTLQKAAEKADNILLSPIYYVQAGELLEKQGKKADALKMYQKVKQYERMQGVQGVSQSSPYVEIIDEYIARVSE